MIVEMSLQKGHKTQRPWCENVLGENKEAEELGHND